MKKDLWTERKYLEKTEKKICGMNTKPVKRNF